MKGGAMTKIKSIGLSGLRVAACLSLTTALGSWGGPSMAQNCTLIDGSLPRGCLPENADIAVAVPAQPNTEFGDIPDLDEDGFGIDVDGAPVAQDGTVLVGRRVAGAEKRTQDLALQRADVAVKFDGLDVTPRLNVGIDGPDRSLRAGDTVTVRNQMNYPAFVTRGELRISNATGRGQTVQVIPLDPNTTTQISVPQGENLVYSYRVYDARGRYDETNPVALT